MTMTLERPHPAASNSLPALSEAQRRAYDSAMATIPGVAIVLLRGDVGVGKSLVIAHLRNALGGTVYPLSDVVADVARQGGKLEEALVAFVLRAVDRNEIAFLEDTTMFDLLGAHSVVDRPGYLHHVMANVYDRIAAKGARLVIASADRPNSNHTSRAALIEMDGLAAEDYRVILAKHLPGLSTAFDADKIARSFRKLTGHQLVAAANLLQTEGMASPNADQIIAAMERVRARSNLVVDDVEDVTLDSLVGIEPIVRELTRTIVIPMTQPELARELGLKPARGLLLYGEPGTGKTTIGRALARQMKGKFFVMDGSIKPEGADKVLRAAEASSPSVLFIDDADVIFKNGDNSGFARKLLTKLDGLESESIGNVCIIMTAMDVADMPPAIVRSGRVEVWLHMELPDARKRADIIRHYARTLPEEMRGFDERKLVEATDGFVPADLRGLVSDARGHIAYDRHKGRPERSFEAYLLVAAREIQHRKAMLAKLSGKKPPKAKEPETLAPPPCTDGVCG